MDDYQVWIFGCFSLFLFDFGIWVLLIFFFLKMNLSFWSVLRCFFFFFLIRFSVCSQNSDLDFFFLI